MRLADAFHQAGRHEVGEVPFGRLGADVMYLFQARTRHLLALPGLSQMDESGNLGPNRGKLAVSVFDFSQNLTNL